MCACAARSIRADLDLAAMAVNVMRFSTQDITATWLLPEAVPRIASMLNYFLMHLTGERQTHTSSLDYLGAGCYGAASLSVHTYLSCFV